MLKNIRFFSLKTKGNVALYFQVCKTVQQHKRSCVFKYSGNVQIKDFCLEKFPGL